MREVKPNLDIFSDQQFAEFRQTLDSEMKHLHSLVLGTTVKQAEPISDEEEECRVSVDATKIDHILCWIRWSICVVCTLPSGASQPFS